MIGRSDLEDLVRQQSRPGSKVLSIYLNVDQSRTAEGRPSRCGATPQRG
jgi:hypothetical protein